MAPLFFAAALALLGAMPAVAQGLVPGSGFRDCPECPEMIVLPSGRFRMGSPDSEPGREKDEGPVFWATIRSFAIGRTHVTRANFAAFVAATGYRPSGGCYYLSDKLDEQNRTTWELDPAKSWQRPGFAQTNNDPVVCVSHDDAIAYVRWLSQRTGRTYRLPSEAEWEYAARAGTTTARWWGDGQNGACVSANVADLTAANELNLAKNVDNIFMCPDGYTHTSPGGTFRPNAFGLHDMLGNAWQWVADCYRDSYANAPGDGAPVLFDRCEFRVLRGGAWGYQPRSVRSASRYRGRPGNRSYIVGFRVARTLAP